MAEKEHSKTIWREPRPLAEGGYPGFAPRTEEKDGMLHDYDVAVAMRDGVTIYSNVHRPSTEGKYPVLATWCPYGKHNPLTYDMWPNCGVSDVDHPYGDWEGPDPRYWCPKGYVIVNVDSRGSWNSEGDLTFFSEQEAQDMYDLIEWAGTQSWSSGKVGMAGVSYLAWSQWKAAALNPPHLAAINPWEGVTDFYRDYAYHGGIPETLFVSKMEEAMSYSTTRIEEFKDTYKAHPLFDDYWAQKNADLAKITVPAYVCASWSDHGLHTRGTFEGYRRISSKDKWLLVHGRKKWQNYYENAERQLQFFDHFLKGVESEVLYWPKVKVEVRERFYVGNFRDDDQWPLRDTQYTKLFLNADDGALTMSAPNKEAQVRYSVDDRLDKEQHATFEIRFEQRTEITGHMKLRLWVEADGGDDMDLFAALQKFDRTGDVVGFPFFNVHDDGPVALGWLRVSHRELDENESTPDRPFLSHQREQKLSPGEIVPVELEILPSGTLFEQGERLQVVVQGHDIYNYEAPGDAADTGNTDQALAATNNPLVSAHAATVNRGAHVIHTGGRFDSHLLVPIIPSRPDR